MTVGKTVVRMACPSVDWMVDKKAVMKADSMAEKSAAWMAGCWAVRSVEQLVE